MEAMTEQDTAIQRRALTLAVVSVGSRVEALMREWRGLSLYEREQMPGLKQQLDDEREALRWLEQRRSEVYAGASL